MLSKRTIIGLAAGAHTISQMQDNAEFIKMSGAGFAESQPHDVSLM